MATISKGILGGFSGKVGTVVGVNWRGMDIIRSIPKRSRKRPTDNQMLQQYKFKLVVSFLQPLRSIQELYFGSPQGSLSRVNLATSEMLNTALELVNDVPELVFERILITKGELTGFQNLKISPEAGSILNLEWENNSTQGNAKETDLVNLICYLETQNAFVIFEGLAARKLIKATAKLPDVYKGKEVHTWAFLNNEKKTQASTSAYLGKITLI